MVAPAEVVTAVNKVKRAFDVSSAAQEAALASLDDAGEIERRRALNAEAHGRARASRSASTGSSPPGRRSATSSTSRPAPTRARSSRRCSREGVIVRPLHGFGAPTAIRVTGGTPDENEFFADALARARAGVPAR